MQIRNPHMLVALEDEDDLLDPDIPAVFEATVVAETVTHCIVFECAPDASMAVLLRARLTPATQQWLDTLPAAEITKLRKALVRAAELATVW